MARKRFDLDPLPQPSAPERDQALAASSDGSQPLLTARMVPLGRLVPDPEQPRRQIAQDDPALLDLAQSLRAQGMRQPITAYYDDSRECFVVISGERRMRAAGLAGLAEVPVLVEHRPASDADRLVLQLAENLVREDLSAQDAARALARLRELRPRDWLEVAGRHGFGRRRSYQYLELLESAPILQQALERRAISEGHAQELRRAPETRQAFLLAEVTAHGLSVADTRRLIKRDAAGQAAPAPSGPDGAATIGRAGAADEDAAPSGDAAPPAQYAPSAGQVADAMAEQLPRAVSPSLGAAVLADKQRRARSRQLRVRLDRIASELRNMHVEEVAAELTNLPEIIVQARQARESLDAFIALLERVHLDQAGAMEPPDPRA